MPTPSGLADSRGSNPWVSHLGEAVVDFPQTRLCEAKY